ncbi:hypothetical protein Nmel_004065 [Mimus melanotis]
MTQTPCTQTDYFSSLEYLLFLGSHDFPNNK